MKKLIISLISVLLISLILTSIVFETRAVGFDVLEDPDRYKQQVGESGEIVSFKLSGRIETGLGKQTDAAQNWKPRPAHKGRTAESPGQTCP